LILPGAALSFAALSGGTAQLPATTGLLTKWKPEWIGRNTNGAIFQGVLQAQLAAAISLAEGQRKLLGKRTRVILTGGLCGVPAFTRGFLAAFPKGEARVSTDLVHDGLLACWKRATGGGDAV
jgi:pantothenate kinase type III